VPNRDFKWRTSHRRFGELATSAQSFDLTELAAKLDANSRFGRNVGRGVAVFWGCAAIAGVFILFFGQGRQSPYFLVGPAVLMIGGGGIVYETWYYGRSLRAAHRRLVVGPDSLVFSGAPKQMPCTLTWRDPNFEVRIYDRTALPPQEYDGTPRMFDFIAHLKGGPDTAIPQQAFHAIIKEAEARKLRVTRKNSRGGREPPGRVLVTISAPR